MQRAEAVRPEEDLTTAYSQKRTAGGDDSNGMDDPMLSQRVQLGQRLTAMEPLSTKVEGWSMGYQVDTDMLGMSGKIMAFEVNRKKYEGNGPVDIIVSEMLKELCVENREKQLKSDNTS